MRLGCVPFRVRDEHLQELALLAAGVYNPPTRSSRCHHARPSLLGRSNLYGAVFKPWHLRKPRIPSLGMTAPLRGCDLRRTTLS
jgi:hypothetical protein